MRPVIALFALVALASAADSRPPVTLVMQFEGVHSDSAVTEMKQELAAIMKDAGLSFDYRLRSELNESESPADIIVVKFKGNCSMHAMPLVFDERGPLALTHTVDGEILPFSEIACDRLRVSLRSALWGEDWKHADRLLGRALGRVLAHEIYHMFAKTHRHSAKGVAQRALTAKQLIAPNLTFAAADLEKLHHSPEP